VTTAATAAAGSAPATPHKNHHAGAAVGEDEEGVEDVASAADDERAKQFLSLPRRTPRGSRGYSSLNRGLVATSYLSRTDEKRRSDSMLFQKVQ